MFCANCGKEILGDSKFCNGCGVSLTTQIAGNENVVVEEVKIETKKNY